MIYIRIFVFSLLSLSFHITLTISSDDQSTTERFPIWDDGQQVKYLIFDVNMGEGWNLRRDVLIRMANLVRALNTAPRTGGNPRFRWILVLPPLVGLYHWLRWARNWLDEKAVSSLEKARVPWDRLIMLHFLQRAVPVIEYDEFLEYYNKKKARVDAVLYMVQDPSVVPNSGNTLGSTFDAMSAFQLRAYDKCPNETAEYGYSLDTDSGTGAGHLWRVPHLGGYGDVRARTLHCAAVYSMAASRFARVLEALRALPEWSDTPTGPRVIFVDRAERITHGELGEYSPQYWTIRRAMIPSPVVDSPAQYFRRKYIQLRIDLLSWFDIEALDPRWEPAKKSVPGEYMAVHMRREDFKQAQPSAVPPLELAARQVARAVLANQLRIVYVATDAPPSEVAEFRQLIADYLPYKFTLLNFALHNFTKDEEHDWIGKMRDYAYVPSVVMLDQEMCAGAQYFIGTMHSTFTYRVQEDRQIRGFKPYSTYNGWCNYESNLQPMEKVSNQWWRQQAPDRWELPRAKGAPPVKESDEAIWCPRPTEWPVRLERPLRLVPLEAFSKPPKRAPAHTEL